VEVPATESREAVVVISNNGKGDRPFESIRSDPPREASNLVGCIGNAFVLVIQTADLIAIGFITGLIRTREEIKREPFSLRGPTQLVAGHVG
jgi:hypothetical protein